MVKLIFDVSAPYDEDRCSIDRTGSILARRSRRWQEKYREMAAFQLLLVEPVCYGILRRFVDGSVESFMR